MAVIRAGDRRGLTRLAGQQGLEWDTAGSWLLG